MLLGQWLTIREADDEKTKAKKRKLQKSWKSKLRFQQMDLETKKRQQSWLNFRKGKGAKKKVTLGEWDGRVQCDLTPVFQI